MIWEDPINGHRVGCLDASNRADTEKLMVGERATLAINDPPYNIGINKEFGNMPLNEYMAWSERWVDNAIESLAKDTSLYIWLGADIRSGLQPLPDFMIMMRKKDLKIRNFITMRNQRGYGTQKNWMAIRQELLYYIKGNPIFNVQAEYTDIPKKTRGYYKKVSGKVTENFERSKALTIRAGNVWHDVQQVFYLMHENVEGCFAQKPLKSAKRIVEASSNSGDYDLYLENGKRIIKVEVKASRAINTKIRGGLETKALSIDSDEPYWMNFQQLKMDIADVFVFVGVWINKIYYWVLTNKEIKNHPIRSHQHRGGIEYQIGITNKNFDAFKTFLIESTNLTHAIKAKVKNSIAKKMK